MVVVVNRGSQVVGWESHCRGKSQEIQGRSTQSGHGRTGFQKVDPPNLFKSGVIFDFRHCICYA